MRVLFHATTRLGLARWPLSAALTSTFASHQRAHFSTNGSGVSRCEAREKQVSEMARSDSRGSDGSSGGIGLDDDATLGGLQKDVNNNNADPDDERLGGLRCRVFERQRAGDPLVRVRLRDLVEDCTAPPVRLLLFGEEHGHPSCHDLQERLYRHWLHRAGFVRASIER